MPKEKGSILLVLLLVLAIVAGVAAFILKDQITSLVSPTVPDATQSENTPEIESDYQNPFDQDTASVGAEYENPFDAYENPFEELE
jgi:hypothetical protein